MATYFPKAWRPRFSATLLHEREALLERRRCAVELPDRLQKLCLLFDEILVLLFSERTCGAQLAFGVADLRREIFNFRLCRLDPCGGVRDGCGELFHLLLPVLDGVVLLN